MNRCAGSCPAAAGCDLAPDNKNSLDKPQKPIIIILSMKEISAYLSKIEKQFSTGNATEHTYRSTLEKLLESLNPQIQATNEPKRIKCGAPDFIITEGLIPLGNIEAKDIGKSLDDIEKDARLKKPKGHDGDQHKRFLGALNNFILTDYLEFRWFENGEKRLSVKIAELDGKGKIKKIKDNYEEFKQLLDEFLSTRIPTIGNPKELAKKMADKARLIRRMIEKSFEDEDKGGSLHDQLQGFKDVLIHDLKPAEFADMYAQTISYGLFAARCEHKGKQAFTRLTASSELPKTNPFLRKMFGYIGLELDERISWAVDELAELLNRADIAGILKNFGKRTKQEDPVVHFYETFLSEYDPKMREARGVYYTPEPVVSYIVRSIDHILKSDFGIEDGLADRTMIPVERIVKDKDGKETKIKEMVHKVLILDPAVGTGTFLHGVIDHIHEHLISKGQGGTWSEYVSKHLLPRLFGFELLMAPYAVAHMKLGLQLKELHYDFKEDERLNIFLTNTLEEAFDVTGRFGLSRWVAEEAEQAGKVKQELPVMVILGNPPYSYESENVGEWISRLVRDYYFCDGKPLGEKNPKGLQDDYVKFIRFAQWRIEKTGYGILGFISNHGYLDNPTFRGMRQSLMNTFDKIHILNLHGNSIKKEKCPDGSKDENVFDIRQGVAIGIFIKTFLEKKAFSIKHYDGFGLRPEKYIWLNSNQISTTNWDVVISDSPNYFLNIRDKKLISEYEQSERIISIMKINSVGIATSRDKLTISYSHEMLLKELRDFANLPIDDARTKYNLGKDTRDWKIGLAQLDLKNAGLNPKNVKVIMYRPFDQRFTYYTGVSRGIQSMPRGSVMNHMLCENNIALICNRQIMIEKVCHFYIAKNIADKHLLETAHGAAYVLPLYLYPNADKHDLFKDEPTKAPGGRRPNLAPEFIKEFSEKLEMEFVQDGKGDRKKTFGPEDVFSYMYAVFHSPTYRTRYAEFLKIDFPRLPLTSNAALFRELCKPGDELVALHLMDKTGPRITKYPVDGNHEVEKVRYSEPKKGEKAGKVWINKSQYFEGVPPDVWEFQIGGYQVCHKWLKDRKGRKLTIEDIDHYQNIVSALSETIRLMAEIDAIIEKYGGWPIK